MGANKDAPVPLRLFEASDVVLPSPDSATGSSNARRLAAVYVARESGFEIIHGLLNRLMDKLGVSVAGEDFICMTHAARSMAGSSKSMHEATMSDAACAWARMLPEYAHGSQMSCVTIAQRVFRCAPA